MTQAIQRIVWTSSIIAALGVAAPVRGEEQAPIKLTLHPMAAPTPALKYRLLYTYIDQIPGNAAVYYGKVKAEETVFFGNRELRDKIDDVWPEMPLEQLKREQIQPKPSSWPLHYVDQGAKCKNCDWQLPIGREPFYTIMLPEAQESRGLSRMLAVKARWDIAHGKYNNAIQSFRTNYALARNVAKGETLVNGLIGIAMCGIMFPQVTEFVQQPDAPNLYWALTTLPSPLINMNDAIEVESNAFELSFPELRDLESAQRTPEKWREITHRIVAEIAKSFATADRPIEQKSPEQIDKICEKLAPGAKESLADAGMPAAKLESMSVHQLALLDSLRTCHRLFDESAKYYSLPYPQAIKGMQEALKMAEDPKESPEIVPMVRPALGALLATRHAITRVERQIAFLRVVEGLRIYADGHGGRLPKQLVDITEVPIPDDPVTCKPFVYRREGDKAFVEGPILAAQPWRFEIKMVYP